MIKAFKADANLLIALSLLFYSCGQPQEQAYQEASYDVDFTEISAGNTHIEKRYPGALEGQVNVDLKPQVTGYLEHIYVKEGDYVKKGQSLFRIKGDVYNQQVNNSQAAYEAALAAEQNARIELEKIRPLVKGGVFTALHLQTAESNLSAASAQVAQEKAALGSSQVNAAFTLIQAPVSGYIGRIPNRIGSLVTPADAVPLTTLSDISKVFVYFSLSEADFIAFMKERKAEGNSQVTLVTADGTVYDHPGDVEIASGNVDRLTGSVPLKAIFPNPDRLLRSGGSGKIILKKSLDDAITIPMASVKDIQDRFFVYVLADSNKVEMRAVEIQGKSDNSYIIKSGLKTGEKIALDRIDQLSDGMAVIPVTPSYAEVPGKKVN